MANLTKLAALAGLAMTAAPALAQETGFFDDFDTLDTKRWYVSDGWNNGAHQNCDWSADQVSASGGMLHVGFAPQPKGDRQLRPERRREGAAEQPLTVAGLHETVGGQRAARVVLTRHSLHVRRAHPGAGLHGEGRRDLRQLELVRDAAPRTRV